MAVIDARFSGGHLEVTTAPLPHDEAEQMVEVTLPMNVALLAPDEARRLAIALIEAASDAEHPTVPDWP
ncbi:hypothetical protein [Curtobacterium sp. MCBD17_013]|uniref:hypothetical protein n=1 Tax=Curtobacterium sp. MCBD17_013 TaxID=2175668 RepID=UPI0011B5DF6E|nr:hypothetical protein [Curtobacterium sp. MCBD17_013]